MADQQDPLFAYRPLDATIVPNRQELTRRLAEARKKTYYYGEGMLRAHRREIFQATIRDAIKGNTKAQALCLERLYPRPDRAPADIHLPPMSNTKQMLDGMKLLLEQAARGEASMADVLDTVKICSVILATEGHTGPQQALEGVIVGDARQRLAAKLSRLIAARNDPSENAGTDSQASADDIVPDEAELKLRELERRLLGDG